MRTDCWSCRNHNVDLFSFMIYHRNFDKTRRVPSIEQKIPTLLDDLCSTPISCVFVLNNPYFSGFVPSFCRGIFCHTRLLIIYIFNLSICDIRLLIIYFLSYCDIRLLIIYFLSFCDIRFWLFIFRHSVTYGFRLFIFRHSVTYGFWLFISSDTFYMNNSIVKFLSLRNHFAMISV